MMLSSQATIDMESLTVKQLAVRYRDYLNNYLLVNTWAADYHVGEEDADAFHALCKACHEAGF